MKESLEEDDWEIIMGRPFLVVIICSLMCSLIYGCVGHNDEMSFDQHVSRARDYSARGKLSKAVIEYEDALKSNPTAGFIYEELGDAYYQEWRSSFDSARRKYIQDFLENPNMVPDAAKHGNYSYYGEDHRAKEKALVAYREALKYNPKNCRVRYLIAMDYLNNALYDKAISEFETELRLCAESSSAYYGIAKAYSRKGSYEVAINHYLKALALDPDDGDTRYELGLAYLKNGDKKNAWLQLQELRKSNSVFYTMLLEHM